MEKLDKLELVETLRVRFLENMHRHQDLNFDNIYETLSSDNLLQIVFNMERTEGMPDVVIIEGKVYVIDMYKEAPKSRVSVCYDKPARLSRTKFPPATSVLEIIDIIGSKLLDENMYHAIQALEDIDLKTSSWLLTPKEIRIIGGAIFGDKRYNRSFVYHNGADSYYNTRGFRTYIELD